MPALHPHGHSRVPEIARRASACLPRSLWAYIDASAPERALTLPRRSWPKASGPPASRFRRRLLAPSLRRSTIERVALPAVFNSVITSPPYMNALDYGRDNRLRLWFIDPHFSHTVDNGATRRRKAFISAVRCLASKVESGLSPQGYCVLVVGESLQRTFAAHPSEIVYQIMTQRAPSLRLKEVILDDIPDVRRTRRECRGIKREHFLVFHKS